MVDINEAYRCPEFWNDLLNLQISNDIHVQRRRMLLEYIGYLQRHKMLPWQVNYSGPALESMKDPERCRVVEEAVPFPPLLLPHQRANDPRRLVNLIPQQEGIDLGLRLARQLYAVKSQTVDKISSQKTRSVEMDSTKYLLEDIKMATKSLNNIYAPTNRHDTKSSSSQRQIQLNSHSPNRKLTETTNQNTKKDIPEVLKEMKKNNSYVYYQFAAKALTMKIIRLQKIIEAHDINLPDDLKPKKSIPEIASLYKLFDEKTKNDLKTKQGAVPKTIGTSDNRSLSKTHMDTLSGAISPKDSNVVQVSGAALKASCIGQNYSSEIHPENEAILNSSKACFKQPKECESNLLKTPNKLCLKLGINNKSSSSKTQIDKAIIPNPNKVSEAEQIRGALIKTPGFKDKFYSKIKTQNNTDPLSVTSSKKFPSNLEKYLNKRPMESNSGLLTTQNIANQGVAIKSPTISSKSSSEGHTQADVTLKSSEDCHKHLLDYEKDWLKIRNKLYREKENISDLTEKIEAKFKPLPFSTPTIENADMDWKEKAKNMIQSEINNFEEKFQNLGYKRPREELSIDRTSKIPRKSHIHEYTSTSRIDSQSDDENLKFLGDIIELFSSEVKRRSDNLKDELSTKINSKQCETLPINKRQESRTPIKPQTSNAETIYEKVEAERKAIIGMPRDIAMIPNNDGYNSDSNYDYLYDSDAEDFDFGSDEDD